MRHCPHPHTPRVQNRFSEDLISRRERPGFQNMALQDTAKRPQFRRARIAGEQILKAAKDLARPFPGMPHQMLQSDQSGTEIRLPTGAKPVSDSGRPPVQILWDGR